MESVYEYLLETECTDSFVHTVIEGAHCGEKAVTQDGTLRFVSDAQGFFRSHEQSLFQIKNTAVSLLEGTRVFSERAGVIKRMVICGGGHVAVALIKMAVMVGFEVTVLEDRIQFAENARAAGAAEILCDDFTSSLQTITGSADTYFVIVTRGHTWDTECLRQIARKDHAYIGMIGSRRRTAMIKTQLVQEGIAQSVLEAVYTPIGLAIGAETPEEIAVAIMAEVISVKNKKDRTCGYTRTLLNALCSVPKGKGMLATIIRRKGSAPRETGTKMLILADGTCTGTIGGGCVESQVQQTALRYIAAARTEPSVIHVDMTATQAMEEGMVCGGTVDILLESV